MMRTMILKYEETGEWGLCICLFFFESLLNLRRFGDSEVHGNGVIKEVNYIEFFACLACFALLCIVLFFFFACLLFFHRYYILSLLAGFEEEFVDLVCFIMAPMVDLIYAMDKLCDVSIDENYLCYGYYCSFLWFDDNDEE